MNSRALLVVTLVTLAWLAAACGEFPQTTRDREQSELMQRAAGVTCPTYSWPEMDHDRWTREQCEADARDVVTRGVQ